MRTSIYRIRPVNPIYRSQIVKRDRRNSSTKIENHFTEISEFLEEVKNHYEKSIKTTPVSGIKIGEINSKEQRSNAQTAFTRSATATKFNKKIATYEESPPKIYENKDKDKPTSQHDIENFKEEIILALKEENIKTKVNKNLEILFLPFPQDNQNYFNF